MTEPKLCPYRKIVTTEFFEDDDPKKIKFGPCLQDKCAMWRETKSVIFHQNAIVDGKPISTATPVGGDRYCGLAGKP